MKRAIAVLGTVAVLMSLVPAAFAQSASKGGAAQLSGLQKRSADLTPNTERSNPALTTSNDNPASGESTFQLDKRVEVLVRPENDQSPGGVYPNSNTADGNQVQVRYRLNQQ